MSTISKPNTFSAGATIIASQHNDNFDTIYNDYNGSISNVNLASNAAIVDTKLASITTSQKVNVSALVISSQAQGDILYASSATVWARLGAGTAGQALTTGGAAANPAFAGMTTQGDVEYHNGTTRTRLAAGTSGHFLKTQGAGANPVWAAAASSFKIGSFTRDISTASGTQDVTGVGFQPTHVVLFMGVAADGVEQSTGFSDGTSHLSIFHNHGNTADTFTANGGSAITALESAGNLYEGDLTTLGADGFTVTWTKTGTPTGTITVYYLAIK